MARELASICLDGLAAKFADHQLGLLLEYLYLIYILPIAHLRHFTNMMSELVYVTGNGSLDLLLNGQLLIFHDNDRRKFRIE